MSDLAVPSYRVRPAPSALPRRALWLGAGIVLVALAVGFVAWRGVGGREAVDPRGVPVLEADSRPIRVRPDQAGGMTVANQDQLVLEPPAVRRAAERQERSTARLAPEAEAPQLEQLRQRAAPPPAPGGTPSALVVASLPPPVAVPASVPVAPPPTTGRAVVQLGALPTEEAARAEWARLQRRVPELAGKQPQVARFDREGQPALWRLRVGGLADARALCEAVRAKGGACVPLGG